jgi:hypothetical protein
MTARSVPITPKLASTRRRHPLHTRSGTHRDALCTPVCTPSKRVVVDWPVTLAFIAISTFCIEISISSLHYLNLMDSRPLLFSNIDLGQTCDFE